MVTQCCYFLPCILFFPFLSYHTVALTTPVPPFTSIQCHCAAPLAYMLTKQQTESRGHTCLTPTFKNSPICFKLSWIYVHKEKRGVVKEVKGQYQLFQKVMWQGGAHFQESSSLQNEGKKLLSGLSALLKPILALCMVLYLVKFFSPSFLLPKLKSPNKDLSSPKKEGVISNDLQRYNLTSGVSQ